MKKSSNKAHKKVPQIRVFKPRLFTGSAISGIARSLFFFFQSPYMLFSFVWLASVSDHELMHNLLHSKVLFYISYVYKVFFGGVAHAANPILFCKCFCGSNSTIFELPMIEKPCGNCTKQFCLDNVKDGICDGIADETCPSNDFKTACFGKDMLWTGRDNVI
jgi:hypothetical protein